jgi:general secretion pathway protein I
LTQIRLGSEFPDIGESNFPCPQGDLPLTCHQTVLSTPNPFFRRIEVRVADSQYPDRSVVKLTQMVPR